MEEKMLLSVGDASLILRVGGRQVRRYCNEGKLVCRKDGKAFEIEYDSVLEFLRSNPTYELDEDIASDEEETDADVGADVRNVEANVRKTEERASEKASAPPKKEKPAQNDSDSLSDISALSDRLQKAVEAARTSQKELADTAHLMLKRFNFERQHNQEIESCLQEVLTGLSTEPKKLQKMSRRFMALLPWILFWISAGIILLLWL